MKRKLSQEQERAQQRRAEAQQRSYSRGAEFRDAHKYEALKVEPTIQTDGKDEQPVIQVWFYAVLKDPALVDRYLRQIDALIRSATINEEELCRPGE